MAQIIKTDRTTVEVNPLDGQAKLTLEQMQQAVGGYVEQVKVLNPAFGHRILFCDEDGLLKQKPINKLASGIAGRNIVGDVLLCDPSEIE